MWTRASIRLRSALDPAFRQRFLETRDPGLRHLRAVREVKRLERSQPFEVPEPSVAHLGPREDELLEREELADLREPIVGETRAHRETEDSKVLHLAERTERLIGEQLAPAETELL